MENSSFIDNFARRGAGLSVFNNNGVVNNCNFTNNSVKFINEKYGPEGAGIYINGAKGTISNCKFENNTVIYDTASTDHLGGGIYIGGDNNIVRDCEFIANNATYGAGVYSSNDAHNTQIINSTFEKNIALYSGASGAGIVSVGPNPKIISCNFTKNYSDHVGGGIYIDLRNTVTKNAGYITDCRFINNSAKNAGGAIHLRDRNEMNFMTHISNVTFENNTATTGGALSVNGPVNVTNSKFTGNNATKGSAIRVAADKSTTNLYLENVTFKNNRADSASLNIDVDPKTSYYPSEVTINITLEGYDNIANVIWNEKDNTHVYTSNITYDVYRNGVLETVSTPLGYRQTTGPLAKALLSASSKETLMLPYQQTVNGAANSDDASLVWQDDREDAQILNVKITNTDKNIVVLDETGYITDVYGNVTEIMKRLKPGHYEVYAKHPGDVYYTEIENTNDFTILYDFNVSKDTDDVLVGVNQTVTYNITLNNTGELVISNIKVNDTIPEGFILLKYTTTWIGVTQDEINQNPTVYGNWKYSGEVFTIDNTVVNSDNVNANSALPEKTSIVLTLTFKATEIGTFNNTVNITSDELTAKNATSQNTTVVPIILNVNKTANVTVVGNNSLVNFTIKVNSTSLVNATNVTVVDCLPGGLDFVDAGYVPVNGIEINWNEVSDGVQWNISRLDNKTVVVLWVTARVNTADAGNLTNNVSVTSKENKTPITNKTNVTVAAIKLNVNKTANVTVVGNNSLVNFTIKVNSTSLVNATNVTVVDCLPGGLDFVDAGYVPVNGIEINWNEVSGVVQWNISRLDNKTVVELWVTARVNTADAGNLTNNVNVTSKENKTPVNNKTNVTVVPVKLNINKTANVTNIAYKNVGESERYLNRIRFTIVVNSTSIINATNVTVNDVLPNGLIYHDAGYIPVGGISISCNGVNNGAQWIISKLDNKTNVVLWIEATLGRTAPLGNITNVVNVTSHENKTVVSNKTNITMVPVVLKINKTANVTDIGNNSLVNYTIKLNNTAVVNATKVLVVDMLPYGVVYENASSIEIDGQVIRPTLVDLVDNHKGVQWIIPRIENSTEITLWIVARTNGSGNQSNFVATTCLENRTQVNDTANITIVPVILTVNKTANVTYVGNESLVQFRILVNNTSKVNVTQVVVIDNLPEGLKYESSSSTVVGGFSFDISADEKTLTWTVPEYRGPIELYITVRTTDLGNFTNNVSVSSKQNSTPVKDNETIHVVPANLIVVKSVNQTNVSVGDLVEFTINVTNVGLINETDKTVTDLLDSDAFEVYEIGNKTYLKYNNTEEIVWNIPSLKVNESACVYIVVKVLADGTNNNTAVVESPKSNKTNSTTNVTAHKIPTHISVGNVTTYPGMNVTIPINVTADDNKTFRGNITIYLPDGSNQTVEIINGTGNVTWFVPSDYIPDVYDDTAKFDGDDTYLPSSGNGTITVLPIPTHTSVANVTGVRGENVTIPINVTADDNKPVNGNVTITLPDGTNQTVEIINGTGNATWLVPEEYVPQYNDTARFPGNETYLPSNGTGIIIVIPIPTHVSVGNITTYPGENVTIPVNVTADDNKPFNGNVTVTLPDGSNQTVEIVNGTGNITWSVPSDYTPDVYNDTVKVIGDEKYLPSNGTGTITVLPIPTHVSVGNITTYPGTDITIPINVTTDDGVPFNGNVTITLPDGSNQTVEIINGTGNATWHVPGDYTPDVYNDTVRFAGSDKYLPSEGVGTVTVIKVPVDITVGNITAKPGDNVTIPIKVVPRDGSVFNGNVTVELPDGSKKTVEIINGEGSVDWTIPMDYGGNYDVKVSFNGTNRYYPSNGTGIITVIPDVVPPVADENRTVQKQVDIVSDDKATGNPILVLLAVLALLGINIRRRK